MTQQPLIPPDITLVKDCGLIDEYPHRVLETATSIRPIPPIEPPNYEMIEIDTDTQ
jgi:hypothetical protein